MLNMFELSNFSVTYIVCLLFVVWKIFQKSKSNVYNPRLPPGPWKLPIIGNLHLMAGDLPNIVLRNLSLKHGPIFHLKLGETNAVIISKAEIVEEVLKTNDISFAQRPMPLTAEVISNGSSVVYSPYNDYWKEMRKLTTTELLSTTCVRSYRSLREKEGLHFFKYVSSTKGKPFNFTRNIFSLLNTIIFKATSGRDCKSQEEFISIVHELIIFTSSFTLHDMFPSVKWLHYITGARSSLKRTQKKVDSILNSIIDDHKLEHVDGDLVDEDFLSVLLKFHRKQAYGFTLTMDNIKAITMEMYGAGSETQAVTIDWGMTELMRNPKVLERAQAEVREALKGKHIIHEQDIPEIPYLKAFIKEILRMHPPAPLLIRETKENCKVRGYDIPKKSKIIVNIWEMHRDPRIWENPDSFEPERFLGSSLNYFGSNMDYLPFGAGRRMCPGILFSLANIEYVFAKLLFHFDLKLPDGVKPDELDMTGLFGASMRRKNDLCLLATPSGAQYANVF